MLLGLFLALLLGLVFVVIVVKYNVGIVTAIENILVGATVVDETVVKRITDVLIALQIMLLLSCASSIIVIVWRESRSNLLLLLLVRMFECILEGCFVVLWQERC